MNSDGKRNMPSGEVFTGPHEAQRQRARALHGPLGAGGRGRRRRRARAARRRGRRRARGDVGDEYLQRALATDDGARCLGEVGIGTNFGIARPTGTILFDEKIGGTVHLALGRSYPETGGKNSQRAALGPHLSTCAPAVG